MFVTLCMLFLHPISSFLEYPDHPDYVGMMIVVVALDSFQCIPFAYFVTRSARLSLLPSNFSIYRKHWSESVLFVALPVSGSACTKYCFVVL